MKLIHCIPHKLANNNTLLLILLIMIVVGFTNVFLKITEHKHEKIKWKLLQAQQSSLHTLAIAKELILTDALPKNCFNTAGCPFWSGYPKIRVTNNDGTPNVLWWKKNAYQIPINGDVVDNIDKRFIVIKLYDNLYKIIAFGEDQTGIQGFINCGYLVKPDNKEDLDP